MRHHKAVFQLSTHHLILLLFCLIENRKILTQYLNSIHILKPLRKLGNLNGVHRRKSNPRRMDRCIYFELINFCLDIRYMHKLLMRDIFQIVILSTDVDIS